MKKNNWISNKTMGRYRYTSRPLQQAILGFEIRCHLGITGCMEKGNAEVRINFREKQIWHSKRNNVYVSTSNVHRRSKVLLEDGGGCQDVFAVTSLQNLHESHQRTLLLLKHRQNGKNIWKGE